MKKLLALALLAFAAHAAHAQDLQPAISPSEVARGQVNAAMMRGHAERDRKAQLSGKRPTPPRTPAEQRRAHQREVEEAMRRRPAAPGSTR